jgi:hypothetical protein
MNTMYRMLHQKFVSPSVVSKMKIKNTLKLASMGVAIFLVACSTTKSPYVNQPIEKPSLEKALHEGIDSMRWGSDSDRLGPRTREPVLEKALFKEVPINVACYIKGVDNGTIHQLFENNPKLNIYCFKDDHLFAVFKLFKGYTSFYTLKPDKSTPPVIEMQNHDKWVTWVSGDGDNHDEIDFNNIYYYQADAGFAMIMNDTIYRDNLDTHEQTAYSQHKSKLHIIYSMVDLQSIITSDPVPEVPKKVVKKKHYKKPLARESIPINGNSSSNRGASINGNTASASSVQAGSGAKATSDTPAASSLTPQEMNRIITSPASSTGVNNGNGSNSGNTKSNPNNVNSNAL